MADTDHDKRIRAEVLAACAQRAFEIAIEDGPPAAVEDTAAYIRDAILKLQPAAAALEALLREERVKELLHFSRNAPGYNTDVMRFIDARIAELEKARAIEEKGGQ